jgi:DNA-binding response OmpR family regulator
MSTRVDEQRLLILDDESPVGRILVKIASRSGWLANHVSTVAEFHARFADCRPDAIMLDLNLGEADGIEQLRFLHEGARRGRPGGWLGARVHVR